MTSCGSLHFMATTDTQRFTLCPAEAAQCLVTTMQTTYWTFCGQFLVQKINVLAMKDNVNHRAQVSDDLDRERQQSPAARKLATEDRMLNNTGGKSFPQIPSY